MNHLNFCPNCGTKVPPQTSFCTNCGSKLNDTQDNENDSNISGAESETTIEYTSSSPNTKRFEDMIISPSEKIISVLKQSYFDSAVSSKLDKNINLTKNIMLLTNKRLYIKAKVFTSTPNDNRVKSKIELKDLVVPLNNVTGAEIIINNMLLAKVLVFLFSMLAFVSLILMFSNGIGWILALAYFIFLIIEMVRNISKWGGKYFFIHHIGGPSGVLVRWYSETELNNFRKNLMLSIDKLNIK